LEEIGENHMTDHDEPWMMEPVDPALVAPARNAALAVAVVCAIVAMMMWAF
jgi:hypothetical protein